MKLLGSVVLKQKIRLICLVICSVVVVVMSLLNTGYIAKVTDKTYHVLAGTISRKEYYDVLTDATIFMIIIMLVIATANVLSGFLAGKITVYVVEEIRNRIYSKVMTFSLKEMNEISIPSMITRSTGDVLAIQGALYLMLTTALPVPFLIIGGIVGVISLGKVMLALLIGAVIVVITIFVMLLKKTGPLYMVFMGYVDELSRVTREGLSGIQILRALNKEKWNSSRIQEKSEQLKEVATSVELVQAIMQPSMYLVINIADIIAIWISFYLITKGNMHIGGIAAFINYLFMTISGIILGAMVGIQLPGAFVCMNRIEEVLQKKQTVIDGDGVDVSRLKKYDVEFNNVSFRYRDDYGMVVKNISFTAKQGEMTVIVGNTGCGKTTLMQLIPRLYDSTEGTVTIGGVDVKKMKLKDLRALIGYVPQRVFLHTGDVRFNISYRDKNYSDEIIEESAELSQSMSFIKSKQKGFEEWISQGGSNFSGGQKQRLTIARALAGNPKILILDDSASALDIETGVKLRDSLKSIVGDITIIFVTQRLSIIRNADKVVLLRDGRLKDVGTYEELIERSDIFRDVLQSQMGG